MIEGYLSLKIEQPFYYNNWDPCGKDVAKFFKAGYVHLPLTHTDTHHYEYKHDISLLNMFRTCSSHVCLFLQHHCAATWLPDERATRADQQIR